MACFEEIYDDTVFTPMSRKLLEVIFKRWIATGAKKPKVTNRLKYKILFEYQIFFTKW